MEGAAVTRTPHFSRRHRQIMLAIGSGASYNEIGRALGISPHTVRAHVVQIASQIPDLDELAPRWRIFAFVKSKEWEQSHAHEMPKIA
jgi:FixJ family two-component response regulator